MTNGEKKRAATAKRFPESRRFGKTGGERFHNGRWIMKKASMMYVGRWRIIDILRSANRAHKFRRMSEKAMA